MAKRATSFEVARLAGVSRATVSRAFAEKGIIDDATRTRVLAVADTLDYRPHPIARSLNGGRSDLVAIVVNSLHNFFESELHDLLVSGFLKLGLRSLLVPITSEDDERALLRSTAAYQVSAALVFSDLISAESIRACFGADTACVMMNGKGDNASVDRVELSTAPLRSLIDTLVSSHRSFAYVGGRATSWTEKARFAELQSALKRHGRSLAAVHRGDFTYGAGRAEARTVLALQPAIDCVIAANDAMALGILDTARYELGLSVPDDLSVVGFDNIEASQWPTYDLTTIATPLTTYVGSIIDLVRKRLESPDLPTQIHHVDTALIWRSTTPAARAAPQLALRKRPK